MKQCCKCRHSREYKINAEKTCLVCTRPLRNKDGTPYEGNLVITYFERRFGLGVSFLWIKPEHCGQFGYYWEKKDDSQTNA